MVADCGILPPLDFALNQVKEATMMCGLEDRIYALVVGSFCPTTLNAIFQFLQGADASITFEDVQSAIQELLRTGRIREAYLPTYYAIPKSPFD